MRLKLIARIAVAAAIGLVLELYGGFKIPVLFPAFLKVDLGDMAPLLVSVTSGFSAGIWAEVVKTLLHMVLKGGNVMGNLANLVAGVAFLLPTLFIPRKAKWGRSLWLLAGPVVVALLMVPANLYIFLPYRGIVGDKALTMAVWTLMPFNLLKFGLSTAVAYVLLPALSAALGFRTPAPTPAASR